MPRLTIFVALAVALAVGAEAAKPKPPKPTTSKSTITKTHTPKGGATKSAAATKTSGVKATGVQAKASTGKSTKPAKSETKLAKADAKATKSAAKSAKAEQKTNKKTTDPSLSDTASSTSTSTDGTASNTSSATAETIDFAATGLGQKLQKNSALRSKIEAKLQAAGYTGTVYEAAYGFKNLGQLNAATNQVQNQGYSFEVLKALMTGTYVDPDTHLVYRANQLPDGTAQLVSPELATNPPSTQSLGQAKQAIAAGTEMPEIILVQTGATQ